MIYNLILTILLSFFLIKLIILYADKLHLIDIPNERSSHVYTTPSGAGMGFIFATFLGIYLYKFDIIQSHWYIFSAISIVLIVGIIDDMYQVNPKTKILTILLAILLLWWNGISIQSLGMYASHEVLLGWLTLPVTIVALVGFTNAFNLIDGIDGLAGMVSLFIIGSFGYIGYRQADTLIMVLSFFTIAGIIPFIILNYNPAKVFMGDSGSLSLGMIISILAILSLKYIHPIAALYFTALPLYDTSTVIIRRLRKGVSIFKPDQTHIHHLLMKYIGDRDAQGKRTGTRRSVWILVSAQAFFTFAGLEVNHLLAIQYNIALLAFIIFLLGIVFVYHISTKIEKIEEL